MFAPICKFCPCPPGMLLTVILSNLDQVASDVFPVRAVLSEKVNFSAA